MNVTKIEQYKHFGSCLSISEGKLTLYVTLDCGPRIIYASYDGSENLFYNEDPTADVVTDARFEAVYGKGSKWHIGGGHRFWISPEVYPYTYYPDNEPVEYEVKDNTVVFTPPAQRVTELQESLTLTFAFGGVGVTHTLKNIGAKSKQCAIWALTVMAPGTRVKVPHARDEKGDPFTPNRMISFWPYDNLVDPRFRFEPDAVILEHDDTVPGKFKLGIRNTSGRIAAQNGNIIFSKGYKPKHDTLAYTDLGVSTELYTDSRFIEVETLGPLTNLNSGETAHHTEYWTFTKM